MLNKLFKIFAVIFAVVAISACAKNMLGKAQNLDKNGVAVKGYDVVAYFTESQPVKGSSQFSHSYKGATYLFSSEKNKNIFASNPEKYAPQYGGFCAFGVTQNAKYDIDPKAFKVVDGKLYLNLSVPTQRIWEKDIPGNIESANEIWPTLK